MHVYKLKEPIHFGSEVITELKFQPLKAKHVRTAPRDPGVDQILVIASKITGVTSEMLDEMAMVDLVEVLKIVGGFLSPGQSTTTNTTQPSP